ncbi:MAG: hypothetical protein O3B13_25175 [Planctomycetota bacterium]|nr:hypothetical protein [Planctomycetota bacterium]MDA1166401.1 hypothetical protein [Planctomycetota bacterium]
MLKITPNPATWQPQKWDDVVGNKALTEYLKEMVWNVRKRGAKSGFNTMVRGSSRSGKTAEITLAVKAIGCLKFDDKSLDPCGMCQHCSSLNHIAGTLGWEEFANILEEDEAPTPIRYFYSPIDCPNVTESDLAELIYRVRIQDRMLKLIYLDEVHRLSRRAMDERLLKTLDGDFPAIWLASSANAGVDSTQKAGLDPMFCKRFTTSIETQLPSIDELARWLGLRCQEFDLKVDDPRRTLTRIAERSNQLPGLALQILNRAYMSRNRVVSATLVEDHCFAAS